MYIEWLQFVYNFECNCLEYLTGDLLNYINLAGIAFKMSVCILYGFNKGEEGDTKYIMLSIAMFFAWTNCISWIRFFDSMSHYFHMIVVTFQDI